MTESFTEAESIVCEFMETFVAERHETAMEIRSELEADPVMADEAEEAIVTEAATDATVGIAGYSDSLLVSELKGLLETDDATILPVLQAVVHRDKSEYDVVYIADGADHLGDPAQLREFSRQFEWLNEQKLATVINAGGLTLMIARFEETRLIRYLVSDNRETFVLLDPDFPLHVPPFERQIAAIIAAKWN